MEDASESTARPRRLRVAFLFLYVVGALFALYAQVSRITGCDFGLRGSS
jgi:hypothetical protein